MSQTTKETRSLKSKVLQSLKWVGSVTFFIQVLSWAITIYVIRILSPADFGLMGIALVFIGTLSMVSELGLGLAIIQKKKITSEQLRQVFGFVIIGNVFLFLLLFIGAPFISAFYGENRLAPILVTLSFIFLLRPLYVIHEALLMKEMDFRSKSIVDLFSNLFAAFTSLCLAFTGFGIWALVWSRISLHLVKAIGYNTAKKGIILPDFRFKGARSLLSFGGFATGTSFFRAIFFKVDMLIGGKMLGTGALGFYAVAVQLSSIPLEKLSLVVPQVAFPAFSSIQSEIDRLSKILIESLRLLNLISIPCLVGISSVAPEIVTCFLGAKWLNVIVPLQILCLTMPLRMFEVLFYPMISGTGRPDLCMGVSIFATIVLSIAFLFGAKLGVIGLCWAWAGAYPLVFVLMLAICQKILHLRVQNLLSTLTIPVLASIAMAVAIYVLRREIDGLILPIFQLMSLVLAGIFTFAVALLAMNRNILWEIRSAFKRFRLQTPSRLG